MSDVLDVIGSGLEFVAQFLLLGLVWVAPWLVSFAYIVWALSRSGRDKRQYSASAQVRFEAIWGMVLAWPAVLFAVGGVILEPGSWWWAAVAGVAALYVVAGLALAGRELSFGARHYPLAVAVLATPIVAFTAFGSDYWFSILVVSRLGLGYVAEVMVGLRFARAVGRRQALEASAPDRQREALAPSGPA